MRPGSAGPLRELVLVGGGHTHVQVLRHFAMEPPPATRVTLVVDTPIAVYSGMVPGFVAGQYRVEELEIDVVPLARRAGARVVLAPATGVDAASRRIEIEGRPPLPYDLASLDVGSTVAGLDLPGVRRHAYPTRPIGRFVQRVAELEERALAAGPGAPVRVVVVGAGAGGVELAFTLERRLRGRGVTGLSVALLEGGDRILAGYPESLRRRVLAQAVRRGITVRTGCRVTDAAADSLGLEGGERLPCDLLLWVTGAVSHPLFAPSGLPTDQRGFVRTRPTLQVAGHDALFAVGDCGTLDQHPDTPKAGVYAVRQGPFLIHNLLARLTGGRLRAYRPQGDFLTLLNLGDGTALGTKWGLSFEGRWVMTLKDKIDRRFMERFQLLAPDGSPLEAAGLEDAMAAGDDGEEMEMLCGGCAAKPAQDDLALALERLGPGPADPTVELGLERPDDAAAWSLPEGRRVVSTIDAFRAFTDDPFLVGRVAAVNAVSDLYAKGVAPRYAQALVALPEQAPRRRHEEGQDGRSGELEEGRPDGALALEPEGRRGERRRELLFQVLAGARAALDPLGVTLLGGHTTTAPELLAGFVVDGLAEPGAPLLRLGDLRAGQRLILTKPLGTGVILHADMQGLARGPWLQAALASMLRPNAEAAAVARRTGATAATDVTGYGLAGHLAGMLEASGLAARLDLEALPALPGALELLGRGVRSTSHPANARARRFLAPHNGLEGPRLELLFDPQTSGGLLFGVPAERAEEAVAKLREGGDEGAAVIGEVVERPRDGALIEVVVGPEG